jgi:HK97 gp10 family phage protein
MSEIIEIDMREFERKMNRFPDEVEREISVALKEGAKMVIDQAREEFKSHFKQPSGKAAQSIQIDPEKTTKDSITVGLNKTVAPYSVYLHEGTGIFGNGNGQYWVEPMAKRALFWISGGEKFFSSGHYVNGIPAFPFLYRAAAKVKEKVIEHFKNKFDIAIKKAGL